MEVTLKAEYHSERPDISLVSILVLMEVTLKGIMNEIITSDLARFNPCFNGSDSKSCISELNASYAHWVSILVLMEVTLKAFLYEQLSPLFMFQSLF